MMLLKSLLLASTAVASEPAFRAWMAAHGRTYEGAAEFEARLAVFVENTAAIAALNDDPEDGATYAMNAFGDLSADEFRAQRLMGEGRAPPDLAAAPRLAVPAGDAPDAVDWRDKGAVTAVRDQGSLGASRSPRRVPRRPRAQAPAGSSARSRTSRARPRSSPARTRRTCPWSRSSSATRTPTRRRTRRTAASSAAGPTSPSNT